MRPVLGRERFNGRLQLCPKRASDNSGLLPSTRNRLLAFSALAAPNNSVEDVSKKTGARTEGEKGGAYYLGESTTEMKKNT